jgi:alginate O-acetyltransferase complex protein AlgI
MLFNTAQFLVFLAVVLVLFYASPARGRRYLLIAASYFFYGCWNVKFIPLLLSLTAIDYTAAIWMEQVSSTRRRKLLLLASLAANLGFLGFFKYYNFFAGNFALLGGHPAGAFHLDIVLPLGISFHTFQSISYVVDVYRGEQAAIRNPADYALFICFFPQLVAGPIVRAEDFFRDLFGWHPPDATEVSRGVFLVVLGLTKKMAFADPFAKVANAYFGNVSAQPGAWTAWSGVFAFGMQIFFDFSGYTDMAIGMALLFGFRFPENFRRPYLSASITEFWQRWHISLSTWLRDYLWFPLGANRHGLARACRNLLITMLLGGLWHGASWNFVVWGGYHGALLGAERAAGRRPGKGWWRPVEVLFTFVLVLVGWVFFRAATLRESIVVLGQMFAGGRGRLLLEPWHLGLAVVALVIALAEERGAWMERLRLERPGLAYASALTGMFLCLELFGVVDATIPFVYFQF